MSTPTIQTAWPAAAEAVALPAAAGPRVACVHCGANCPTPAPRLAEKSFCCQGCLTVYELLTENGLGHFYELEDQAGIQVQRPARREQYAFLDEPAVRARLVDFTDGKVSRVTLHVPTIHCIACVWLLENLFRLRPGLGKSTVNFPRKELAITFEDARVPLSELVALLASLGYEPTLSLGSLDPATSAQPAWRKLLLQLGVAGFAFGNIMLFSICLYSGLDSVSTVRLQPLFGYLSLALALPVVTFSASDYWRSAWICLRQRVLTIELPIAVGLVALFAQSAWEVCSKTGVGYLDSLAGLIFFLLLGRVFQQKTYDRLSFDRDYKSFFPLSVVRQSDGAEAIVPISQLVVGDRLVLRHGELIPADARVLGGRAVIDYSFVTGESDPVEKAAGELVFAGGQQTGGAVEVETVKPVSQSYLTSLWSHEAFAKVRDDTLNSTLNRFTRRFTLTVAAVAVGAAVWWWAQGQPGTAVKAFISVLIVACPCALALSAPFALGTAQRVLGRRRIFLKNPQVIEALAKVNTVVFDKTGTLTAPGKGGVDFQGAPLAATEATAIRALARHSSHPHSARLAAALPADTHPPAVVGFHDLPGSGIEGEIGGRPFRLGSATWLAACGVTVPTAALDARTAVHLAIAGSYRGHFLLTQVLPPETEKLIGRLTAGYELALLSGDNERERERFRSVFGPQARLDFNQSPVQKLEFIAGLQRTGKTVMMVGDGLNDAGALRQSDVGVAVVENIGAFSPASDVILEAASVPRLGEIFQFSRGTVSVIWASILISSAYNLLGLSIAASGRLAPVVCAVLMPLSSISVVAFACGATQWRARRAGLVEPGQAP